jgi:uncharacterized protein
MLSVAFLFEAKILDFPTSRQDNNASCGSTCVQTVLAYYGIDERQDDLSDKLKMSDDGISYTNIIKIFKKYNLSVDARPMTINDLKKYINKKIPVIILVQAYKDNRQKKYTRENYNNGHYIVAIGYNSKQLIVEDPALNNQIGYISFNDLETRWHGVGETEKEKLDYFGIAVIGKPKYDSDKIVKVK